MNWIYVLYISEFILFLVAFLLSKNDIMAPSVIMCVMFIISTTVAILAADHVKIMLGGKSCAILIAGISTFVFTEAFFRLLFQRKVTHMAKIRYLRELQDRPFQAVQIQGWLVGAAIIMVLLILYWHVAITLRTVGGFGKTLRSVQTQTVTTAGYNMSLNTLLTLCMKIVKALGYIAGFVLIQRILAKEKGHLLSLGLLLLMIMCQVPSFLSASRGSILQFIIALLAEYNILWHQKKGWHRNMSWKFIRIGILCIAIGIPVFYYSVVWMGRTSWDSMRSITEVINIYLGYPIYLFDWYVKNPTDPIGFGEESLIGLRVFLRRLLGTDMVIRNPNLEEHYANGYFLGNVYTFFRRPLHDFGFIGMLIFTVLVALFFSWLYYGKIKWKSRSIKTDCWSLIYGFLFFWIVYSSIVQYSMNIISLDVLMTLVMIVIGYRLLSGLKVTSLGIKFKKKSLGYFKL